MTTNKKFKIQDVIDHVADQLKSYNFSNIAPTLVEFQGGKGMLTPLLRGGLAVPRIPGLEEERPSLLLHGLGADEHKNTDVYKYIDKTKIYGPGFLYGTSGVGKTRSLLEYLSHNYGVYLVAGKTNTKFCEPDPGSADLQNLWMHVLPAKTTAENTTNLQKVSARLQLLLFIRHTVLEQVNKRLLGNGQKALTAYQWLLLQLYPIDFFECDIFQDTFAEFFTHMDADTVLMGQAYRDAKIGWGTIVVDEAQVLLKSHTGVFFSEKKGVEQGRSAYSAMLKGLLDTILLNTKSSVRRNFPIFSGTGMMVDDLIDEATSGIAKYSVKEQPAFSNFQLLTVDGVEEYMRRLLDFSGVRPEVLRHLANWLRGRPRWTATYVEESLVRSAKTQNEVNLCFTKGSFRRNEENLIHALDRFLRDMTTEKRRGSWASGNRTAYTAIKTFNGSSIPKRGVLNELERAIFRFAIGKKSDSLKHKAKELIQKGVAALAIQEYLANGNVVAVIDEPIIVEACIRYYNMDLLAQNSFLQQEQGGQGDGFEKLCLDPIRTKLKDSLVQCFPSDGFEAYDPSTKSCYGVIAKCCKDQHEGAIDATMDWIEAASSAWFEGTVPPMCLPDDIFGADIICLFWNLTYTRYRMVLSQSKYRTGGSQSEAMGTLVPAWIYHQQRGKNGMKVHRNLKEDQLHRWEKMRDKVTLSEPCVRVLIQYPATATEASKSNADVHQDSYVACELKSQKKECTEDHDWFYTVDGCNGSSFFNADSIESMNHRKGLPLDHSPSKKRPRTEVQECWS